MIYELHVGTFTPEGTYGGVIDEARPPRGSRHHRDRAHAACRLRRPAQLGLRRRAALRARQRLWPARGPEGAGGGRARARADGVPRRGLQPLRPEGQLPAPATRRSSSPTGTRRRGARRSTSPSATVREYFIHNALYWLEEYRFDGLRFDAVHAIVDESPRHILEEIACGHAVIPTRDMHLVLENDANQARFVGPGKYNAQWNDDSHHALPRARHGRVATATTPPTPTRRRSHLARCLAEGFAYQGEVSPFSERAARRAERATCRRHCFVDFLQNHDQVGNRAFGERLTALARRGEADEPLTRHPPARAVAAAHLHGRGVGLPAAVPLLLRLRRRARRGGAQGPARGVRALRRIRDPRRASDSRSAGRAAPSGAACCAGRTGGTTARLAHALQAAAQLRREHDRPAEVRARPLPHARRARLRGAPGTSSS